MILYRLMCKEEFEKVCEFTPISWNSRFKWFTDDIKFLNRVSDGIFYHSKFKQGAYDYLVIYEADDPHKVLHRVSNHEIMLRRIKQPFTKFKIKHKCLWSDFNDSASICT